MLILILTSNRFILIQNILFYNQKQIPFIKDYANNHNLTKLNLTKSILDKKKCNMTVAPGIADRIQVFRLLFWRFSWLEETLMIQRFAGIPSPFGIGS
jgi:hypothetical protein